MIGPPLILGDHHPRNVFFFKTTVDTIQAGEIAFLATCRRGFIFPAQNEFFVACTALNPESNKMFEVNWDLSWL